MIELIEKIQSNSSDINVATSELRDSLFPLWYRVCDSWLRKEHKHLLGELLDEFNHVLYDCAVTFDKDLGVKFTSYVASKAKYKTINLVKRETTKELKVDSDPQFQGETALETLAHANNVFEHDERDSISSGEFYKKSINILLLHDEKYANIINLRFKHSMKYRDIAAHYGCSRQAIEQLLKNKIFPILTEYFKKDLSKF